MLAPIADIKIHFFGCHACTVHTVKPGYVVTAGEGNDPHFEHLIIASSFTRFLIINSQKY